MVAGTQNDLEGGAVNVKIMLLSVVAVLEGCASTSPVKIGADTYYASKTNTAGIFGDVSAVIGKLLVEGNEFCANQGKQLELITEHTDQNVPGVRFGAASITFKCVDHASNPVMRKDNGVSTVKTQ
jgi:hypothetical protein